MEAFATWVSGTSVSWFVTHYAWVWVTCEVLHFVGMSLLIGCIGLLDLRLLGIWAAPPVWGVNALVRWGVLGFAINAVTGLVFVVGDPLQYLTNPAFRLKVLFLVLACWNVAMFYVTGLATQVESLQEYDEPPTSAKMIAGTSLFLWIGVIFLGRILPFAREAF
jgi:hypothetical protein